MKAVYTDDESVFLKKIGNRIRELRIKANLSQEKLAFDSDLDRTYVGSIERGERNVSALNLRKMAKALNVHISDLLKFI